MSDLTIRPLQRGETEVFSSYPFGRVPGLWESERDYAALLAAGEYRPEHTWVAIREDVVVAASAQEILEKLRPETDVVAIDEVQFFDWTIADVCSQMADENKRVIVAGLDLDFRGEPFGPMPLLLALAERVDKLNAICVVCGAPASRTQRLVNGEPTRYDDPIIMVGGSESYEARCRACHDVPGKPAAHFGTAQASLATPAP